MKELRKSCTSSSTLNASGYAAPRSVGTPSKCRSPNGLVTSDDIGESKCKSVNMNENIGEESNKNAALDTQTDDIKSAPYIGQHDADGKRKTRNGNKSNTWAHHSQLSHPRMVREMIKKASDGKEKSSHLNNNYIHKGLKFVDEQQIEIEGVHRQSDGKEISKEEDLRRGLLDDSHEVFLSHRRHIELMMESIREEMSLLASADCSSSNISEYLKQIKILLKNRASSTAHLLESVERLQAKLENT